MENKFHLEIKELLYRSDSKVKGVFETFVFEPDSQEEKNLGRLLIVGGLNEDSELSSLINLLVSVVKREYYSETERGPAVSLEASLKKANSTLAEFVVAKKIKWPLDFSFNCASLKDEQIIFAQSGNASTLLCRENKVNNIGKQLSEGIIDPNPYKTFQNIASGSLRKGDRLVLSSMNMLEFMTREKMKQIFSSAGDAEKISGEMRKIWEKETKNKSSHNLALIILGLEEPKNELLELGFDLTPQKYEPLPPDKELTIDEIINDAKNKNLR